MLPWIELRFGTDDCGGHFVSGPKAGGQGFAGLDLNKRIQLTKQVSGSMWSIFGLLFTYV